MNATSGVFGYFAQVFFAGLWQGVALAVIVAISLRLYPRVSATIRFVTWSCAFATALIVPLLHSSAHGSSSVAPATGIHLIPAWGYAIAGLWAVLMLYRAAQLAVHIAHLHRVRRNAIPIAADSETLDLLKSGRRPVDLCTSTDVDSPSVIGFWSPRLLIPEWLFAKLTPDDLRQIALHELEHVRRGDGWINLMQKIGLVLFPLNPALLWMDRQLSIERELACDAGVVARTGEPVAYAGCLTRLAEQRLHYRKLALALSAWSRQSELGRRVQFLLRPARTMSRQQAGCAAVLLGVAIVGCGAEMVRAPRLVSFSGAHATAIADVSPAPVFNERLDSVRAVPAAYRPMRQRPHEILLNAVMAHAGSRPTMVPATKVQVRRAHRAKAPNRPHLVMTSTSSAAQHLDQPSRSRVLYTVYVIPDFSPSYTAVPFSDGWLIVQL